MIICDRCKKEIKNNITITYGKDKWVRTKDICEECWKAILDFIDKGINKL